MISPFDIAQMCWISKSWLNHSSPGLHPGVFQIVHSLISGQQFLCWKSDWDQSLQANQPQTKVSLYLSQQKDQSKGTANMANFRVGYRILVRMKQDLKFWSLRGTKQVCPKNPILGISFWKVHVVETELWLRNRTAISLPLNLEREKEIRVS